MFNKDKEPEKEDNAPQALIVNGDTVEYSTESKEFSASGNVVVIDKGTKLTCDKLTLNSATKDCQAEGNVRMEDQQGVIEGQKIIYNFQTKKGIIIDAQFRSNPFFGRAEKEEKASDAEFITYRGSMSTCNYDNPHWRMKYKKMNFFPGDKVQVKDSTVYIGKLPVLYLPQYNHSLRDPLMQVQLMAGSSKTWGPYLLTAWRYSLTEDIKGRIYLDYRANYGNAQGLGVNYFTDYFGRGDFKFYYTQERNKSEKEVDIDDVNAPKVFQRYFVRLRHKWDIDEVSNVVAEYHRIVDSKKFVLNRTYNILKDFFPLEYEGETPEPISYILFHRSFAHASMDMLLQPRTTAGTPRTKSFPK